MNELLNKRQVEVTASEPSILRNIVYTGENKSVGKAALMKLVNDNVFPLLDKLKYVYNDKEYGAIEFVNELYLIVSKQIKENSNIINFGEYINKALMKPNIPMHYELLNILDRYDLYQLADIQKSILVKTSVIDDINFGVKYTPEVYKSVTNSPDKAIPEEIIQNIVLELMVSSIDDVNHIEKMNRIKNSLKNYKPMFRKDTRMYKNTKEICSNIISQANATCAYMDRNIGQDKTFASYTEIFMLPSKYDTFNEFMLIHELSHTVVSSMDRYIHRANFSTNLYEITSNPILHEMLMDYIATTVYSKLVNGNKDYIVSMIDCQQAVAETNVFGSGRSKFSAGMLGYRFEILRELFK